MGLVQIVSGTPRIDSNHKALVSIKDYMDRSGSVDGKRLTDHFTSAPFGWSADTLRYLVAALLVNGEIKLKISGREIKVNGQQAVDGLRTNKAFKSVGVSMRDGQIPIDVLARAAERLTEMSGEMVTPLEQNISKAATTHFPKLQQRYGSLAEKLKNLGLPGANEIRDLNQDLADVLETDASDLPQRMGSPDSTFYNSLKWAAEVTQALEQGLEKTISSLREHLQEIQLLPETGILGQLRQDVEETLTQNAARMGEENFYQHSADLNSALTSIKSAVSDSTRQMVTAQEETIREAQQSLQALYDWDELTQEEGAQTLAQLDALIIPPSSEDLRGLKQLIGQEYTIQTQVGMLKKEVTELARERRMERLQSEKEQAAKDGEAHITRSVWIPAKISSLAELEKLILQLQTYKNELALYSEIEITIEFEE